MSAFLLRPSLSVSSTPQARLVCRRYSTPTRPLGRVTVIGAGLMGSGIAQVLAQSGIPVTLHGLDDKTLDLARSNISHSLERVARKKFADTNQQKQFSESTLANLSTSTQLSKAMEGKPDLIIEAIVEKIEAKRELFKELDEALKSSDCIFTSNTSSLKIGDISSVVTSQRQAQFAGLHFFNPVPQMKLVEIVQTQKTSEETMERLTQLCRQIGKVPVKCKDVPGFIVNRLLVPYLLEALRMLERGEATPEDIDTAMKLGAGHPMGPIALSDYVGLDTMKFIADGWRQSRVSTGEIDAHLVTPVKTLDSLVEDGKLGVKTKHGFYKY